MDDSRDVAPILDDPAARAVADSTSSALPRFRMAAMVLLLAGIGFCLLGEWPNTWGWELFPIAVATGLALVPSIARVVVIILDRIRRPRPLALWGGVIVISILSSLYYCVAALTQGRDLYPKFLDESCYLIQAHILARGQLWMPQHELPRFFDSFYMIVKPVYTSIYFPGTALINVPAIWLGLPWFFIPLFLAGACVGLTYAVVTELVDGAAGLLAAMMLLALPMMGTFSIPIMSQTPMMVLLLALMWAWIAWRRNPGYGRALLMGVLAGWAMITRPLDAICFLLPLCVAIVMDLPTLKVQRSSKFLGMFAIAMAGAAPFLAMQLALDLRVTGSLLQTPHEWDTAREFPGLSYLARSGPTTVPADSLPQKRAMYERFHSPQLRTYAEQSLFRTFWDNRLRATLGTDTPSPTLLIFIPVALLALQQHRWILVSAAPLFWFLYTLYPEFPWHYALVLGPSMVLCVVLGGRALEGAWPRQSAFIATAMTLLIVIVCAISIKRSLALTNLDFFISGEEDSYRLQIHNHVQPPAVVLFTYHEQDNPFSEMVYNVDVAWPDDATIIHANDLGPVENKKIFEYYAQRQPQRRFWRLDRHTGQIKYLGTAAECAARK